jgi:hypothetical protein
MSYIFVAFLFSATTMTDLPLCHECYSPHRRHIYTTTAVTLGTRIPARTTVITHLCNSELFHKRCTTFSSKCSGGRQRRWCACDNIVMYGWGDVHVHMKYTGCAQRDVVESQNDKNQLGYRKECELLIRGG